MIIQIPLSILSARSLEEIEYDIAQILLLCRAGIKTMPIPGKVIANYDKTGSSKEIKIIFTGFIAVPVGMNLTETQRGNIYWMTAKVLEDAIEHAGLLDTYLAKSGVGVLQPYGPLLNGSGDLAVEAGEQPKSAASAANEKSSDTPTVAPISGFVIRFSHNAEQKKLSSGLIADDASRFVNHLNEQKIVIEIKSNNNKAGIALSPVVLLESAGQSFAINIPNCNPASYGIPPTLFTKIISDALQNIINIYLGKSRHYFTSVAGYTADVKTERKTLSTTKNSVLLTQAGVADESVPREFLCQVTHKTMDEPIVVAPRNVTYADRRMFAEAYAIDSKNPFTQEPVSKSNVLVVDDKLHTGINFFVKTKIGECFNRDFLTTPEKEMMKTIIAGVSDLLAVGAILDLVMSYAISNYQLSIPRSNNLGVSLPPKIIINISHADLIKQLKDIVGKDENDLQEFKFFLDAVNKKAYSKALRHVCKVEHEKVFQLVYLLLQAIEPQTTVAVLNEQGGSENYNVAHHAAINNDQRLYPLVVQYGANVNLPAEDGQTAAQLREAPLKLKSAATAVKSTTVSESSAAAAQSTIKSLQIIYSVESVYNNRYMAGFRINNSAEEQRLNMLARSLCSYLGFRRSQARVHEIRDTDGRIISFNIVVQIQDNADFIPDALFTRWAHAVANWTIKKLNPNVAILPWSVIHTTVRDNTELTPENDTKFPDSNSRNTSIETAAYQPSGIEATAAALSPPQIILGLDEKTAPKPATGSGSPITQAGDSHDALTKRINSIIDGMADALAKFDSALKAIENKQYNEALRNICAIEHPLTHMLVKSLLAFKDKLPFEIDKQVGENNYAAIHHAALNKDARIYDLLVEHGAKTNLNDVNGNNTMQLREATIKAKQATVLKM